MNPSSSPSTILNGERRGNIVWDAFTAPPQNLDNGPSSFDSLFMDDDADDLDGECLDSSHDADNGSFTIIDDCVPPRPPSRPDVDAREHLRPRREMIVPKATDKMKNKVMNFWHNVKYGWTVKTKGNFNKNKPIFLLSKCYDCRQAHEEGDDAAVELTLIRFKQDFTSRIWITYRQGFPCLTDTQLTSDVGWGCMIRSGQMMLAQALVTHFLGREWNMFSDNSDASDVMHREILKWFADQPSHISPFSLHRLVRIGKSIDRRAGDWYGPAHVAILMEKASGISSDFLPLLRQVCVYVAHDCTIYKDDLIKLATGAADTKSSNSSLADYWKAVVIIVPVKLGTETLNPLYIPCLKGLFLYENFLGIIGGTPGHSMYFVGFQDKKLIHLDPHLNQDAVDVSRRDFPIHSYHCVYPRKIAFDTMDPSCALGFYCRTRADFETFIKAVKPYLLPPSEQPAYPIFTVENGCREDMYKR